ncbi:5-methylcytosine restriction system specificity protein McrC [Clostridium sp.]|uniref:McrC family protein n=1 Tax=Clostridium sp. TaxID=1506 RepID=UPI002905577F|nr:hypothetical protein [Clostridium sp.]MDU2458724.1 hypothetical protein [Clostridium sp.]MDU7363370.1 hypothetical protein [Clostridium sp.]
MKTKYIVIREAYDWLSVGSSINELTIIEFNLVCNYLKTTNLNNAAQYGFNKIKFINYVGIISVENLVIEILPKISITNDIVKDRKMLMFMLSKCNKISVNINEVLETNIVNQSLLDILAKVFTKKLLLELQKGLYLEYVTQEDSLNKIKGKVMLTQNAKINYINKLKVYCRYDEFTENNIFNSILLRTTNLLLSVINDSNVKKDLNIIKSIFSDIEDIYIPLPILENYKLNKKNERFKEAFILAKLILNNSTMNKSLGKENGFSILFEMNYLYEEYIGILLKETIEDESITVNTQEKSKYLLHNKNTGRNEIALKPDIVIYKDNKPKIIIDTKWKSTSLDGREIYSQSDIYQMYAYITTYKECEKCILLYPKVNEDVVHSIWMLNSDFRDKEIIVREVSLENYGDTKMELAKLFG